jgi:hypothetical protein
MGRTWLDSHNEDSFMAQQRMAGQASAPTQQDALAGIIAAVREKAAAQFKATELRNPNDTVRASIAEMARQHLEAYQRAAVAGGKPVLDRPRDELVLQIVDAILGLGELQSLLSMEGVEDADYCPSSSTARRKPLCSSEARGIPRRSGSARRAN